MFDSKSVEIIPVDAVLPARQPERSQVAFFYPSQDRHLAYAAMPGYGSRRKILRIIIIDSRQLNTPYLFSLSGLRFTFLTFELINVNMKTLTESSQKAPKITQKSHNS